MRINKKQYFNTQILELKMFYLNFSLFMMKYFPSDSIWTNLIHIICQNFRAPQSPQLNVVLVNLFVL
jgi:hypothetical protein